MDVDSASLPIGISYFLNNFCLFDYLWRECCADVGGRHVLESGSFLTNWHLRLLGHVIRTGTWLYHLLLEL